MHVQKENREARASCADAVICGRKFLSMVIPTVEGTGVRVCGRATTADLHYRSIVVTIT